MNHDPKKVFSLEVIGFRKLGYIYESRKLLSFKTIMEFFKLLKDSSIEPVTVVHSKLRTDLREDKLREFYKRLDALPHMYCSPQGQANRVCDSINSILQTLQPLNSGYLSYVYTGWQDFGASDLNELLSGDHFKDGWLILQKSNSYWYTQTRNILAELLSFYEMQML
jgi:hypothetical protein